MAYEYENLICSLEDHVMLVEINRPKVLNALNSAVFSDLFSVFSEMRDDAGVRAVVLTGSGEKAFAAGSDLSEMAQCSLMEGRAFALRVNRAQQAIAGLPKPTIAAVNGLALGGGLEVAMCCDIRIASEKAKLANPEINVGLIPGGGGTQRLARLVGSAMAKQMVYTGEMIDAETAYRIGLVSKVVPPGQLLEVALALAKNIAGKSPVLLALAKQAFDLGRDLDMENALRAEIELFAQCFATEDGKEGMKAFVEKRKAIIVGR